MKNFEIGEKVKCIDRYGLQNIKIGNFYTVIGYRGNGLVILDELPDCAYDQTFFEPIKEQELNEKYVLGKFNKKEGNKMIESINLIDLYAKKAEEKLVKDNAIKNAKIRNNDETLKEFNEIMENTKIKLEELYISQLDEKDLLKFREGKKIASGKYPFVRFEEIDVTMSGAMIDPDFTNDEIVLNSLELSKKIDELHDFVKVVKAHVGIAKTKEEVEEILARYGIIDKKGKLVIK